MLDPKHYKLYFLLIAFFQMNILSSQNTEDLVRQIRIYFEQLQIYRQFLYKFWRQSNHHRHECFDHSQLPIIFHLQ